MSVYERVKLSSPVKKRWVDISYVCDMLRGKCVRGKCVVQHERRTHTAASQPTHVAHNNARITGSIRI
jgi:hypothetical protein